MKKPYWIAGVIFVLCLISFYHTWNVHNFNKTYYGRTSDGSVVPVYSVDDATDLKYARLAAMGDFSHLTNRGNNWFSYPAWTAKFWYPLTWLSPVNALIVNHIVLSLCVALMAYMVIGLPGGWIIAIIGFMAARYSLDYGNAYPMLCLFSMSLPCGFIALLMKPYMAIFPILGSITGKYRLSDNTKIYVVVFSVIGAVVTFFNLNDATIVNVLFMEEPNDWFIHKRQFILVFPLYWHLIKYIPQSWFTQEG